jgi:hypothetical protein
MGIRLLTANQIANMYTLEQIDAKIVLYQGIIDGALSGSYTLDTTQGRQSVTTSDPDKVSSFLSVWMKAREIKTGTYTGCQKIHVNYTP